MLGFSPISSSPIASGSGTFLLTCIVPSVALQSSTPSIGVSSPSSVSLSAGKAEAYSSSVINVTVSSITLTPFSTGLNISSSALGVLGQIGRSKADGIPVSSAARTGTLIPVALTGVIGSIKASSNPIAGINSINIMLPSMIVSASSNPIAGINSINIMLPSMIVSATSNITAGVASINFGAMEVAHTFTYFIKSSSYILLGSRTTEVKLFSRGKFI